MKHLKLLFAFGLGFLTVIAVGLAADAGAERAEAHAISALERRVHDLENAAARGDLGQKVVEPFQVFNKAGREIFYAGSGFARVSHPDDDHSYVQIVAGANGGSFSARSLLPGQIVDLNVNPGASLEVDEKFENRIELGKDSKQGNYRLKFLSGSGQPVAGIGVSSDTKAGLALIGDRSGNKKANIGVNANGTGFVQVVRGENVLASLTEDEHTGGYLLICNAKACDPPMVDAGDDGAFGVVRVGPLFRVAGPTGAPGSLLKGKSQ